MITHERRLICKQYGGIEASKIQGLDRAGTAGGWVGWVDLVDLTLVILVLAIRLFTRLAPSGRVHILTFNWLSKI